MGIVGSKTFIPTSSIPSTFGEIRVKDLRGQEHSLSEWDGKVKIVINVASNCGLTKGHNKELFELRDKFGPENFEILAFPCRQFASQEFKTNEETLSFCERTKIPFPVFATSDVNGPNTNPAFLYCKWNSDQFYPSGGATKNGVKLGDVGWNYGKFLVDKNNGVYKYYGPRTKPRELAVDIQKLINGEVTGMKRDANGVLKPSSSS